MSDKNPLPRFIESEMRHRRTTRFLWCLTAASWLVSLVCALAFYASATRVIPVVVFDAKGQPVLFENTLAPRLHLDTQRVEYFAEHFIKRYVGMDSANIKEDLTEAMNMMTPRLRTLVKQDEQEGERRRPYLEANLKTLFPDMQFSIGQFDPDDTGAKLSLYAWGRMESMPKFGTAEGPRPPEATQWFLTELILTREPITKQTIHGLLVDYARTYFFDTEAAMRAHGLRQQT